MSFLGFIGAILLFFGIFHIRTYLQRKRWPVVEGTLDAVDVKIEGTVPTEGVGFFIRPKYIHRIRYSYLGRPYVIELSEYKIEIGSLQLKVNPEKPSEAFLNNKTLIFPVLAIGIGILLIIVLIKIRGD